MHGCCLCLLACLNSTLISLHIRIKVLCVSIFFTVYMIMYVLHLLLLCLNSWKEEFFTLDIFLWLSDFIYSILIYSFIHFSIVLSILVRKSVGFFQYSIKIIYIISYIICMYMVRICFFFYGWEMKVHFHFWLTAVARDLHSRLHW